MGASESVCILDPASDNYSCTANSVQIPGYSTSFFEKYLIYANNPITNKKVTYSFECKINEETLFGEVYCNASKNQITIKCGDESRKFCDSLCFEYNGLFE